jgi:hypothetical protein
MSTKRCRPRVTTAAGAAFVPVAFMTVAFMVACLAVFLSTTAFAADPQAADPAKPAAGPGAAVADTIVAGKPTNFANSDWSGVPETGPDSKVRQCVLTAKRSRTGGAGTIDTALSVIIGRGAGLVFAFTDGTIPPDKILDDQAEIALDDRSFPADAFTVGTGTLALHPGDAAGALTALGKAATLTVRSGGAGIDSGPVALDLPAAAVDWLGQCGVQFGIAIDRPSDPNAGALPVPRRRSPAIGSGQPSTAGPPGIDDKQNISGWEASELRDFAGKIVVCFIRQHYSVGSGARARVIGTYLLVSRARGLTMMLKDSSLKLPEGQKVEAALTIDKKPFVDFAAQVLGSDEIGIFPGHGTALAQAVGDGAPVAFDAQKIETIEFPVPSGIVPWLRACARRNGLAFEP